MPFSLHFNSRTGEVAAELQKAMNAPGGDLASAALAIARVEYPSLNPGPYVATLDRMGEEAAARLHHMGDDSLRAFNEYLYDEQGFTGNRDRYDDPRNSFINEVLDRRTGIPISLAVVYLEVARRAGLQVDGVNFPGHFLLRARDATSSDARSDMVIIDPFHGGARLSEYDCRQLLRQHVGDEAAFDTTLLAPATRHDIVVRILGISALTSMRSFPQARSLELMLASTSAVQSPYRAAGVPSDYFPPRCAIWRSTCGWLRMSEPRTRLVVYGRMQRTNRIQSVLDTHAIWALEVAAQACASFN